MKVLILSDIHGNYYALRAVLGHVPYDALICCGDIVVDYPFPELCVNTIREYASFVCIGNNDHAVAFDEKPSEHVSERWRHYGPALDRATALTVGLMGTSTKDYLKGLARECRFSLDSLSFYMNHTVPDMALNHYLDIDVPAGMLVEYYRHIAADIVITGHTHVPYIKKCGEKILINPGSVGEPRDGDPRASFAVLDSHTGQIQLGRIEYDAGETIDALKEHGFPGYSLFCVREGFLPDDPYEA